MLASVQRKPSKKNEARSKPGYHWKPAEYKLSPNEIDRLMKEERDRRRKLRIVQVREQAKRNAAKIRQDVKDEYNKQVLKMAVKLQEQYDQERQEKLKTLEELYVETMRSVGQAHRDAALLEQARAEDKKDQDYISAVNKRKAETRHKEAVAKLRTDNHNTYLEQNKHIIARQAALDEEKARAAEVASRPPPPADPIANIHPPKVAPVKISHAGAYSGTHYHIPESGIVEKASSMEQIDARDLASKEQAVRDEEEEERRRAMNEQREKARIRHKNALHKERLKHEYSDMLHELSDLQRADAQRRSHKVANIPTQIYQPPHRRIEEKKERQMDMERDFEDLYLANTEFAGDLSLCLDPQPPPDTPTATDSLDLSTTMIDEGESPRSPHRQGESSKEIPAAQSPKATVAQPDAEAVGTQTEGEITASKIREGFSLTDRLKVTDASWRRLLDKVKTQRDRSLQATEQHQAMTGIDREAETKVPHTGTREQTGPAPSGSGIDSLTQYSLSPSDVHTPVARTQPRGTESLSEGEITSQASGVGSGQGDTPLSAVETGSTLSQKTITTMSEDSAQERNGSSTLRHTMEDAARIRQKPRDDQNYLTYLSQEQQKQDDLRQEQMDIQQELQKQKQLIEQLNAEIDKKKNQLQEITASETESEDQRIAEQDAMYYPNQDTAYGLTRQSNYNPAPTEHTRVPMPPAYQSQEGYYPPVERQTTAPAAYSSQERYDISRSVYQPPQQEMNGLSNGYGTVGPIPRRAFVPPPVDPLLSSQTQVKQPYSVDSSQQSTPPFARAEAFLQKLRGVTSEQEDNAQKELQDSMQAREESRLRLQREIQQLDVQQDRFANLGRFQDINFSTSTEPSDPRSFLQTSAALTNRNESFRPLSMHPSPSYQAGMYSNGSLNYTSNNANQSIHSDTLSSHMAYPRYTAVPLAEPQREKPSNLFDLQLQEQQEELERQKQEILARNQAHREEYQKLREKWSEERQQAQRIEDILTNGDHEDDRESSSEGTVVEDDVEEEDLGTENGEQNEQVDLHIETGYDAHHLSTISELTTPKSSEQKSAERTGSSHEQPEPHSTEIKDEDFFREAGQSLLQQTERALQMRAQAKYAPVSSSVDFLENGFTPQQNGITVSHRSDLDGRMREQYDVLVEKSQDDIAQATQLPSQSAYDMNMYDEYPSAVSKQPKSPGEQYDLVLEKSREQTAQASSLSGMTWYDILREDSSQNASDTQVSDNSRNVRNDQSPLQHKQVRDLVDNNVEDKHSKRLSSTPVTQRTRPHSDHDRSADKSSGSEGAVANANYNNNADMTQSSAHSAAQQFLASSGEQGYLQEQVKNMWRTAGGEIPEPSLNVMGQDSVTWATRLSQHPLTSYSEDERSKVDITSLSQHSLHSAQELSQHTISSDNSANKSSVSNGDYPPVFGSATTVNPRTSATPGGSDLTAFKQKLIQRNEKQEQLLEMLQQLRLSEREMSDAEMAELHRRLESRLASGAESMSGISDEPDLTLVSIDMTLDKGHDLEEGQGQKEVDSRVNLSGQDLSQHTNSSASLLSFEAHERSLANTPYAKYEAQKAAKNSQWYVLGSDHGQWETELIGAGDGVVQHRVTSPEPNREDQVTAIPIQHVQDTSDEQANDSSTGLTLQEAFSKRRQDFINSTKQRHEAAKQKVKKATQPKVQTSAGTTVGKQQGVFMQTVANWKQKKGAQATAGQDSRKDPSNIVEKTSADRKKSEKEAKERTERLYNQLEEVKAQKVITDRAAQYAANRQKAKLYHQKHQEQMKKRKESKK